MPILVINTGTSSNKGDGDTLRVAFNKINENFKFLSTYTGADLSRDVIPSVSNTYTLGSSSTVWKSLYLGPMGLNLNGNNLTVNTSGNLTLNGVVVGTGTTTATSVALNLTFGPITGTTTDPFTLLVQATPLNFGTITSPSSLGFNAGTII